jgi:hypothetical protein
MAQYEHLPIFRTAFRLAVYLEEAVRKMSRYHKYSTGFRLRDRCARLIHLIIRANNVRVGPGPHGTESRLRVLEDLRLEVEALKTDIQLAKELKAFASFDAFRVASGLAVNLGRQGEGWLRSMSGAGQNRTSHGG